MYGRCPDTFYCNDGSHSYSTIKPALLTLPAYVGLVSGLLSSLGATIILSAYCAIKDLRKETAQIIVTLLALADLFTALSSLLGSVLFIAYDGFTSLQDQSEDNRACYVFDTICQIQSFIGICGYMSSMLWTSILATHFSLIVMCNHLRRWNNKLLPLYNIISWGVPLTIALPLLVFGLLGFTPTLRSSCFIAVSYEIVLQYSEVWWIPEVFSIAVMILGHASPMLYIICKKKNQTLRTIGGRFALIIVAYLLLRLPDMAQMVLKFSNGNGILACSATSIQHTAFIISVMQALTDSGQGFVNCILYIFLSSKIRKRMFLLPFQAVISQFCSRKHHIIKAPEDTQFLKTYPPSIPPEGISRSTHVSYQNEFSSSEGATDTGAVTTEHSATYLCDHTAKQPSM